MKPSDQDANKELPLSRPGGGSQDSIDREAIQTLIVTAIADGIDAYEETGTFPPILGNRATDEILELVTAWHNTQLKAAIPEPIDVSKYHPDCPPTDLYYAHGYNTAIDLMQANLEKL